MGYEFTPALTQVFVGQDEERTLIRIMGRATHKICPALKRFISERIRVGCIRFEIDLGACPSLDSTFLGLIAGVALQVRDSALGKGSVALWRVNAQCRHALVTLGIDRLVFASWQPVNSELSWEATLIPLAIPQVSRAEWANSIVENHQVLSSHDARNAARFMDVLSSLQRDLHHR